MSSNNDKEYNEIMKNEEIYDLWEEFINNPKYSKYFISNEDQWKENLEKSKKFI